MNKAGTSVNVLVALYRPDHPHHERATRWFRASVLSGEAYGFQHLVLVAFLRLVTNPRVVHVPATFDDAWGFAKALLASGAYVELTTDRRWVELARIAHEANAAADLVTDAYIAASAAAVGATLVSFDRDLRRFDGLRLVEPT